jgi:hypothetical protein
LDIPLPLPSEIRPLFQLLCRSMRTCHLLPFGVLSYSVVI